MITIRNIIVLLLAICATTLMAQSERTYAKDGNKLYEEKKFNEAEIKYRKSLEKNNNFEAGKFNLGDALYQQGKYDEAATQFEQLAQASTNKDISFKSNYNLGNAHFQSKRYKKSIEAYKKALKQNPSDNDTRLNLSYAMRKLKEEQEKQKQKNNDKKDDDKKDDKKEDNKEDKKKQEEKKDDKKGDDKKEDKDSDNKKEGKEDDKMPSKPDPKKISEGDAKRILDALNQQEKNVQKKLSKKESQQVEVDKNW